MNLIGIDCPKTLWTVLWTGSDLHSRYPALDLCLGGSRGHPGDVGSFDDVPRGPQPEHGSDKIGERMFFYVRNLSFAYGTSELYQHTRENAFSNDKTQVIFFDAEKQFNQTSDL